MSLLWYYPLDKVFPSRVGVLGLWNYGHSYELMPFPETLFVTEGGPRPSTRVYPLLSVSALWYYPPDKVFPSLLGALVLWNSGQSYEPKTWLIFFCANLLVPGAVGTAPLIPTDMKL